MISDLWLVLQMSNLIATSRTSIPMTFFSNLPNEIIAEIFRHCLPNQKYGSLHPRHAPLLLTHVCSSWRRFATHTPPLWQNMKTVCPKSTSLDAATLVGQVLEQQCRLWWNNSQTLPVNLMIDISAANVADRGVQLGILRQVEFYWIHFAVSCFLAGASRVRKFYWSGWNLDARSLFCDLPSTTISQLQDLHFKSQFVDSDIFDVSGVFFQAPALRRVILDFGHGRGLLQLPWRQLTHLIVLHGISSIHFYDLAEVCRVLEVLEVSIKSDDDDSPSILSTRPISSTLSHLQSLKITICDATNPSFFKPLNFPFLREFGLYSHIYTSPQVFTWNPIAPEHDHLYNQLCNLRTLKLGYQIIPSEMMLEMLHRMPFVEELALDVQVGSYADLIKGLTYDPKSIEVLILPRLKVFHLYVEIQGLVRTPGSMVPFSNDEFISFALSRSKPQANSSNGHPGNLQIPSRLRNVFLCVENVVYPALPLDLDVNTLTSQIAEYPELEDLLFSVRVDFSWDKQNWLLEEVETW